MNDSKINVLNNIIGINPTGTIDYQGTYILQGSNNIVRTTDDLSSDNLYKTQNNEIICNNIEKFENRIDNKLENPFNNKFKNHVNEKIILLFILLIFLIILLFYI
jgi:hypothetical protein